MPIMIWIAIIIEAAIQNFADMGILLGIQFINATLGWCVQGCYVLWAACDWNACTVSVLLSML